jgi:hypothetical protein
VELEEYRKKVEEIRLLIENREENEDEDCFGKKKSKINLTVVGGCSYSLPSESVVFGDISVILRDLPGEDGVFPISFLYLQDFKIY